MNRRATGVGLLADPSAGPLTVPQTPGGLTIQVPANAPDSVASLSVE